MTKAEILKRAIMALSDSPTWADAAGEWELATVWLEDEPGTCLCSHYPIIEHCLLVNARNARQVVVGNCCVKRFTGLPSDAIFRGFKRVMRDESGSLTHEAMEYAYRRGWVNDWEQKFYLQMIGKRKLTGKQEDKKKEINERVLEQFCGGQP